MTIMNNNQLKVENSLRYKVLFSNKASQPMNLLERMAHYNIQGISIAVVNNGKIDWADAYGVADIENKEQVTINTLFQAGSISKSITAFGILQLVQQGIINLDVDVNQYLTSWQIPDNEFTAIEKVTLRRILSHSAGLTVSGFPGYPIDATLPTITQVLDGVNPPANTEPVRVMDIPGTKWNYSGGGTTIAQLVIEDVTRQPFQSWMKKNVLDKLGMNFSTFEQTPEKNFQIASGYYSHKKRVSGRHHFYPEMAAAGLWSTPTDLAKFIICMQECFSMPAFAFAQEMLRPQIQVVGKYDCGLGTFLQQFDNDILFEHDGQDKGFITRYRGLINHKSGFVIMINSYAHGWYLMDEISNSIADIYGWNNFSPIYKSIFSNDKKLYKKFMGTYKENVHNREILILSDGNKLSLNENPEMPNIELYPEDNHRYFTQVGNHFIEFMPDINELIMIDQHGESVSYYKLD